MITCLKVQNFKSLRDFQCDLGPINVLVGPNMAGKSNVIDVFRFLFDLLHPAGGQQGLWYALNSRGAESDLPWKGPSVSLVNISVQGLREDEPGSLWSYELGVSFPPNGIIQVQRESLKLRRKGEQRELISERPAAGTWLVNYDGREIAGVPGRDRSVLQGRVTNWDGDFLARLIGSWRFHQFVPALMKSANPTGLGRSLDRSGTNISAWLMWIQTHYSDQFEKITRAACDLLPGFRKLFTSPTQQGTVFISAQESGLAAPINLWQMSDGEIALLALLSLIYSPPEWAGSLYCLEEPENYLYPKLLNAVVRLLRQVREEAVQAGLPLSQLIIATQSPQLVDLFTLDEVIWLEKREGATVAVRPRDKQHLKELVSDKELGLADVVYSGILSEPG
ncbi:MAG TPA: AAA family ATPase [Candidatus Acidoferrum sp.]|nr:AAA family ATPase [Candidatus Acidoferrum sp.]